MPKRQTRLDIERDHVFDTLEGLNPADEEYTTAVNNLKTLHQLEPESSKLNVNTLLTVVGYVLTSSGYMLFQAFGHSTISLPSLSSFKPKI